MSSNVTIRLLGFNDVDRATRVAASNAIHPERNTTTEEAKFWDELWETQHANYPRGYLLAQVNDEPAGLAYYGGWPWWGEPGRYLVEINVVPRLRCQGIGLALYERALDVMSQLNPKANLLMCKCREDQTDSVRFIHQRGFQQVGRDLGSRLDLTQFDATKFAPLLERLKSEGIEILSQPQLAKHLSDWQRRCYEMNVVTMRDVPVATGEKRTDNTFEQYVLHMFESPHYMPEAHFIALDNGQYVGESNLMNESDDEQPTHLQTDYTGVIPSHRRRGIATALKVAAAQYAKEQGVQTITTNNDDSNPMYQLNLKIGFEPVPADLLFELVLA